MPAFAFPAEAGTHLPTSEGWKAEMACNALTCESLGLESLFSVCRYIFRIFMTNLYMKV